MSQTTDIAGGVIAAAGAVTRPLDRDALFAVIKDIAKARGAGLTQAEVDRINAALDGKPAAAPPVAAGRDYSGVLGLVAPNASAAMIATVAAALAEHAPRYGQDATPERLAEFVAQIANETGGFTTFSENLNYSEKGLLSTFGRHRISAADAAGYGRNDQHPANKEMIANTIYGGAWGRKNLGNTEPGDGWLFRGRGALQLTGRGNFRRYGEALGLALEANPDLASDPAFSVLIALEFFKQGKVNAAIDRGDFREARRITNGGAIGLEEVARLRAKALQVLK